MQSVLRRLREETIFEQGSIHAIFTKLCNRL